MRKIVSIILALFVVFGIGSLAFASDVSGANYYGVIRATNTGTAVTNVAANVSINTTALIDSGFLDATATNAAVRVSSTDVPFMPGYDGEPWIVHYENIGQNSNSDVTLYTGNVTGGKIVFFPDPASDGLTIPYDPSLALGNNFVIRINNLLMDTDNGTDKYIFRNNVINVFESTTVSGDVTAEITKTGLSATLYPDGPGYITQWAVTGAATNWQAIAAQGVDEYVKANTGGTVYDSYTYQIGSINQNSIIDSVKYYIYCQGGSGQQYVHPFTRLGGVNQAATTISLYYVTSPRWYDVTISTPPGGGVWEYDDILNLEAGFYAGGYGVDVFAAKLVVTYHDLVSVTVSNVAETEQPYFELSANTTHLKVDIGGSSNSTALYGFSIPANTNDLIFLENGSVIYAENITLSINGTPVSTWKWELGNTFYDLVGSNDGTAVFRTDSSDPDVSTELINFNPYSKSTVDDDTALTWPTIMTDPPELPDTMYTENTTPGFFFAGIIHALSTVSDIPESLFWYNFAFAIIIIVGILVYYIVESSKSNTGTPGKLFIKILCQAILMCVFALPGLNIYGFFVPLYYLFFGGGIFMLSKDFGW